MVSNYYALVAMCVQGKVSGPKFLVLVHKKWTRSIFNHLDQTSFLYGIYYMAQKNFFFLWEQNGKFQVDKIGISCQLA